MRRYGIWLLTVISLLPLALLIYGYLHQDEFLATQETVRKFVLSYGAWSPLVFIIIQILQVVITPISHYAVGLAGGFIFGPVIGSILNWIGRTIGHTIAFAIARYVARPFVDRLVGPEKLAKYDRYVSGSGFLLFLAFFLPFFPDDELSYVAGASRMTWPAFLAANLLGQVGGSVGLAVPGAGLDPRSPAVIAISIATLVAAGAFFYVWRSIRRRNMKRE